MSRAQRHEVELEKLRVECRELQAVMHTTQMKASSVINENLQLHRALRTPIEMNQYRTNDDKGRIYTEGFNVAQAEEW
jgi:regulator of replication initiation timing